MKSFIELDVKWVEDRSTALLQKTDLALEKGPNNAIYDIWDHLYKLEKKVCDIKIDSKKKSSGTKLIESSPPAIDIDSN